MLGTRGIGRRAGTGGRRYGIPPEVCDAYLRSASNSRHTIMRFLRRFLVVGVLVSCIGVLIMRHKPTADTIRAHNPVAKFGRKLADDLQNSKLGRAFSKKSRGPVVYRVR